jgi:hypothetical protein
MFILVLLSAFAIFFACFLGTKKARLSELLKDKTGQPSAPAEKKFKHVYNDDDGYHQKEYHADEQPHPNNCFHGSLLCLTG